jgi:hypothetical protein
MILKLYCSKFLLTKQKWAPKWEFQLRFLPLQGSDSPGRSYTKLSGIWERTPDTPCQSWICFYATSTFALFSLAVPAPDLRKELRTLQTSGTSIRIIKKVGRCSNVRSTQRYQKTYLVRQSLYICLLWNLYPFIYAYYEKTYSRETIHLYMLIMKLISLYICLLWKKHTLVRQSLYICLLWNFSTELLF